ncbi:chromosome partitioning protein ParA [Pseudomonas aeruginosa]|uniref:chromosome partitioning protein ParA n=1 Tax=Pseudomonas aeruginosa TaxID=287 RepID=UPI001A1B654A|nr:chromosome partitioning protein ParA [Pseudomonas aeruginosa]MBH4394029.1 chromosome partitioning protein ParA [Pseudomonas aeruginosa]HCL3437538.1 chromosome partitioning protein ParA [Pseudomonas aeruginosa]
MDNAAIPTTSHARPRLWVETLWLLDSLTAQQPLREIPLQRGLNLIVSPPGTGSAGHGVGKTAFCQLLRFVLDDPLWSDGSTLRDELLQSRELKDGAVAARVHVGGEVWTVLKPWLHQKHYRASRTADWRQLAANDTENEFNAYQTALRQHLVEILPIQELPTSKQSIEWHQILAWCSRDQNARYHNYYQWRADGVRFSLPAKSPAALMQIVLGLLHDATTLRDLDSTAKEMEDQKSQLQALREEPARLLKHVRRQLTRRLNVSAATPFRQDGLLEHPNLIDIAKQRHDAYQQELRAIETERQGLAADHQAWMERRAPLKSVMDLLANEIEQVEALIAGDIQRVEELQNEASSLQQRLPTRCDAGNRLLKDCSYVIERIEQTQIDRKQRIARHQRSKESLESELPPLRSRLNELETEASPIAAQLAAIDRHNTDLDARYAQSLSANQLLSEAIEDYEHYESIASGRSQSTDIEAVERKLEATQRRHERHQLQLEKERDAVKERRRVISDSMQAVAKSLPSFRWGVFNDEEKYRNHPFRMGPMHSTTFKVLEILAGDIACLLDSTREESFHPGFLLHDSPREAEMSEAILWSLLGHAASSGSDSFQYIVTTSTEPTEAFKPFERLRLSSDNENGLLLRRRLGANPESLT